MRVSEPYGLCNVGMWGKASRAEGTASAKSLGWEQRGLPGKSEEATIARQVCVWRGGASPLVEGGEGNSGP